MYREDEQGPKTREEIEVRKQTAINLDKITYQNYLHLVTSVLLFQIYYQKKSFLTTPNIENKFLSSTNSSESLKRLFYQIATLEILPIVYMVSVNFEIHFLSL